MATPQEQLQADLTAAMKARDRERTSTLRMLLTALKNERIRLGEDVDEAGFHRIVQKSIKQRKESSEAYSKGGRDELAEKEEREAEILAGYLPPPAGEEELRAAIEGFVAEQGLEGPQAMGRVMQEMVTRFSGRADGGTISRIAREVLG